MIELGNDLFTTEKKGVKIIISFTDDVEKIWKNIFLLQITFRNDKVKKRET